MIEQRSQTIGILKNLRQILQGSCPTCRTKTDEAGPAHLYLITQACIILYQLLTETRMD